MIVDLRIYTCQPNRMAEFVKLYESMAREIQKKYLGRCLGWYTTLEGPLNRLVHLCAYESRADREQRRAAMAADPGFQAYLGPGRGTRCPTREAEPDCRASRLLQGVFGGELRPPPATEAAGRDGEGGRGGAPPAV